MFLQSVHVRNSVQYSALAHNKSFKRTKKQLAFAPSSLILTNNFLPFNEALYDKDSSMKLLSLFLLITISLNIEAKEVQTDLFKITLPDAFHVETDKKRRLLAFGGSGPNDVPFLSIEFGKKFNSTQVIDNVNSSLKQFGKSLEEDSCTHSCQAYFVEMEMEVENETLYRYHLVVRSERIGFIISYGDKRSLESGREFIKALGQEILQNVI